MPNIRMPLSWCSPEGLSSSMQTGCVWLTQPFAEDVNLSQEKMKVRRYHYLYSGRYGSPRIDSTDIAVEKVEISTDRQQLTLTFPVETYPIGMAYAFQFGDLKFGSGDRLQQNEAWYTVHQIPDSSQVIAELGAMDQNAN